MMTTPRRRLPLVRDAGADTNAQADIGRNRPRAPTLGRRVTIALLLFGLPTFAWAADDGGFGLGFAQLLGLFVVTLGPLKLIGPFGRLTADLSLPALRRLALHSSLIATLAVSLGGGVGLLLATNWGLSTPILTVATGLIFFLVAVRTALSPYDRPEATPTTPGACSPFTVAFPMVVTPYGMAAVVALLTLYQDDPLRTLHVALALLLVMLVNLLVMLFVRGFRHPFAASLLQLLGAVLGVLQVALALRILFVGLAQLGAVPGVGS